MALFPGLFRQPQQLNSLINPALTTLAGNRMYAGGTPGFYSNSLAGGMNGSGSFMPRIPLDGTGLLGGGGQMYAGGSPSFNEQTGLPSGGFGSPALQTNPLFSQLGDHGPTEGSSYNLWDENGNATDKAIYRNGQFYRASDNSPIDISGGRLGGSLNSQNTMLGLVGGGQIDFRDPNQRAADTLEYQRGQQGTSFDRFAGVAIPVGLGAIAGAGIGGAFLGAGAGDAAGAAGGLGADTGGAALSGFGEPAGLSLSGIPELGAEGSVGGALETGGASSGELGALGGSSLPSFNPTQLISPLSRALGGGASAGGSSNFNEGSGFGGLGDFLGGLANLSPAALAGYLGNRQRQDISGQVGKINDVAGSLNAPAFMGSITNPYDLQTGLGRTALQNSLQQRGVGGSSFGNQQLANYDYTRALGRGDLATRAGTAVAATQGGLYNDALKGMIQNNLAYNNLLGAGLGASGSLMNRGGGLGSLLTGGLGAIGRGIGGLFGGSEGGLGPGGGGELPGTVGTDTGLPPGLGFQFDQPPDYTIPSDPLFSGGTGNDYFDFTMGL